MKYFYTKITEDLKRFHCVTFEISFLENGNILKKTRVLFFSSKYEVFPYKATLLKALRQIEWGVQNHTKSWTFRKLNFNLWTSITWYKVATTQIHILIFLKCLIFILACVSLLSILNYDSNIWTRHHFDLSKCNLTTKLLPHSKVYVLT